MNKKQKFAFEQMEQRLLFSADLDGGLVSGAPAAHAALLDPALTEALAPSAGAAGETGTASEIHQELVLVDTDTPGYQQLVDDLLANEDETRHLEVILLDNTRDGIHQVTEILSYHSGLDAVHIISHGTDGAIDLGGGTLDSTSVQASAGLIETWSEALTVEADLLIYGCNLAATEAGQSLVTALGSLTGADVAASDDLTGSAALGGDWELEYATGRIEAAVAFTPEVQQQWGNVLLDFFVDTNADTVAANLGDGTGTDATGAVSLRAAIMEANFQGGAHTIHLSADTYDLTIAGSGESDAWTGDLNINADITIVGVNAATTIIDANGLDRVFEFGGSKSLTLTDMTVRGGSVSDKGGGILAGGGATQLTLTRVIVTGNTADDGGGIYSQGTMILTDVVISNNGDAATATGGGIHNRGSAFLDNVTINGNRAVDGGGLYNATPAWGMSLTNVTVSGNTASGTGGGLLNYSNVGIVNSTFTQNTAGTGGAISHDGWNFVMKNSIVAANTAGSAADIEGDFNSQGYNLIGDATGSTGAIGTDVKGTTGSPKDPLLGALADNGGFTPTHALLTGSLAINGGDDFGAPVTDQRGFGRVGTTDIGAYEAAAPVVLSAAGDTWIDNGANGTNYGDSTSLVINQSGSDIGNQRALLQFDLSTIPAGATITGATLQMQATANTGAFNINVYELTESWVEGSANGTAGVASWDERQTGTAWGTAGGSYDPTIVATLNTGLTGQHSWDLTSLVQAWVGGSTVNNGIIIGSPDGGGNTVTYDSSEGATPPALVITYTLPNTAATVGGADSGAVTEDDDPDLDGLLETGGALTVSDPDAGEDSFIGASRTGLFGDLTIDAAGNWTYAADNTQAAIQSLAAGATLTDTIAVDTVDGTRDYVSITINGANDTPVIVTNNPLTVPEGATRTITSAYLQTTDADNSADEIVYELTSLPSDGTVRLNGSALGLGGTFTQDDVDNNRVSYQDDDNGVSTSFQFTVSDGSYTSGNNTFSVNGSPINDAPVVTAPAASLSTTEQTDLEIAGTGFSVSDADDAGNGAIATLSVGEGIITVASGTSGVLVTGGNGSGSVTLSGTIAEIDDLLTGAGTITYYNGSDNPGASTVFTVKVNDQGNTGTDPGLSGDAFSEEGSNSVTINITAQNDAPSIGGVDTGGVTEDVDPDLDGLLETSGTLTITDADTGEAAFTAGTSVGTYGSITINAAGTWFYAADNTQAAIQSLAAGATLTDTITVTTVDGTAHNVVITITGTNDAAVIGGVDSGAVTEDVGVSGGDLTTTGLLTITDDTGEASFAAGTVSGSYGDLTIDALGNWSYSALNSQAVIQSLAAGATLTDSLTVTSADGTTHDVAVVITGSNDAPTVANPNPNQVATIDNLFSFRFALNTFDDVDGDNLTFTATLGDGSALPGWLSFDAATRTLSGTPTAAELGKITLKITADDGKGGTVSDVFDLKVSKKSGAPVIIEVTDPGPDIKPAPDPKVIGPPVTDPDPGGVKDPGKDPAPPSVGGDLPPVADPGAADPVPSAEPVPETERPGDPKNTIPAEPQVKQIAAPADFSYDRAGVTAKALMRVSAFVQELDDARQVISDKATIEQRIVGSTMTVTTGLSVGYVIWLIRGGVLLSSVLSSLPAWRMIDPLPVLAFAGRTSGDDEDDDSLESMVNKGNRATHPQHGPDDDGEDNQE